MDIGDGWAIAFKIESHNHPSAVEPFQGAATGVGGIIRDIFTMGARPILSMNSLRFGPIEKAEAQARRRRRNATDRLFAGVVAGIAHYGNCIGIPTVGGEVYFDESLQWQPAGQRALPRRVAPRPDQARQGGGRRQPGHLRRQRDGTRRTGGRGVRLAGTDRGIAAGPAGGAGGRSVHGEAAAGSLPGSDAHKTGWWSAFRTWARRG